MFIHLGSIIVEKKGDLEKAMEDAINIGAEDVEEFQENDMEYFQVSNKSLFFKYLNNYKRIFYIINMEECIYLYIHVYQNYNLYIFINVFLLQFKCDPKLLNKVKHLLEGCQYCVLSAEEDYIPQTLIELSESDLEAVSYIRERVLSLEDVSHIHDNLAQ